MGSEIVLCPYRGSYDTVMDGKKVKGMNTIMQEYADILRYVSDRLTIGHVHVYVLCIGLRATPLIVYLLVVPTPRVPGDILKPSMK